MSNLLNTALAYFAAGLTVLPNDPIEKYPVALMDWEKIKVTEALIREWWRRWPDRGIGVRDVEGLDFDNKGHPSADDLYSEWYSLVEELAPGLALRLLLERTPSGGYHTAWRCEVIQGSQKLATRPPTPVELSTSTKARSVTLIETRGTGGQFMVAPSTNYELLRGDWTQLPIITPAERLVLLDCARALTQHVPTTITGAGQTNGTGPRPGDEYNASGADEALEWLTQAGWRSVRNWGNTIYLCRPGKQRGVSATFGHVAPGVLYVFSSNASPFEPERAYSPFAIYATLEHNGDFKAAAKALAVRGYGTPIALSGTRPALAVLDEPPHPADSTSDDTPVAQLQIAPVSSFPELPAEARLPEELGADACIWLDEYIAFSRYWSPQSYDGFHEACGLWVLSTIAARRVLLPLGGQRFTNLYIALSGITSVWAKTTAAKIAKDTISAAGISQMLAPDISTPQAFLRRLAERVPTDYGKETPEAQDHHRAELAFAGQRGWFHDEFGSHIAGMMREGGTMADFRGHLRVLDDCPSNYSYETVGHGLNIINRPYLALLASLTPADLAPFARKGGPLWRDGYFARFAFVTPPANAKRSHARFPLGERTIPISLSGPLKTWHEQLGIPDVEITELFDEKKKPTGVCRLVVTPVNPQRCTLGTGVYDAFYRYRETLIDMIELSDNHDLDGSYSRLPEKALRIAMLLASIGNHSRIELKHWARAQQVAERWRASLHALVDQLGQSDESPERVLEDKIGRLFTHHEALTAREVGRYLHISSGEAERLLEQMVKASVLQIEPGKRTKRYRATEGSVATVTVSQVSTPKKSCDTSMNVENSNEEVSQNIESSDSCDTVTVATLPSEIATSALLPLGYSVTSAGSAIACTTRTVPQSGVPPMQRQLNIQRPSWIACCPTPDLEDRDE